MNSKKKAFYWNLKILRVYFNFLQPTSMPSNQTFSELLDSFIAVEMNRTNATKTAEEVAANRKSQATMKFLKDVGYANYVLENIRRYFVAGEMWLDFLEGESQLPKETVLLVRSTIIFFALHILINYRWYF